MFITINQAIAFWDQLVACYYKTNGFGSDIAEVYTYTMGFGSDTAEVYIYTMMEHSPLFANNPSAPMAEAECLKACRAMLELCQKFARDYDCTVVFADGTPIEDLGSVAFNYRIRLKVIRAEGT